MCVHYMSGDNAGKLLAFATLTPVFLVVAYASVIVARRETVLVYMLLGQLLNELLNALLKKWIQEPRPGRCVKLFF